MKTEMSDRSNSVAQLHGLAKKIHDEHSASRAAMATRLEHAIKAGKFLREAKSIVEHGELTDNRAGLGQRQPHQRISNRESQ